MVFEAFEAVHDFTLNHGIEATGQASIDRYTQSVRLFHHSPECCQLFASICSKCSGPFVMLGVLEEKYGRSLKVAAIA